MIVANPTHIHTHTHTQICTTQVVATQSRVVVMDHEAVCVCVFGKKQH